MMHRAAGQDPSHVRPPLAIEWGMRVTVLVRKLVMNAMRRNPENRSAFESESRTPGKKLFHPLGRLVSAMRQQPVIAHADAKAPGNPPQKNGDEECFPGEEKQRCNRADVKQAHRDCSTPVNAVFA